MSQVIAQYPPRSQPRTITRKHTPLILKSSKSTHQIKVVPPSSQKETSTALSLEQKLLLRSRQTQPVLENPINEVAPVNSQVGAIPPLLQSAPRPSTLSPKIQDSHPITSVETQSQTPAIGQQLVRNTIPQSLISPQPISKTLQVHDTQPNTSKGPSTPQPVRNDKITDPQPSTTRKPLLLRVKTPVWLSTADVPQPRGTSSELIIAKSQAVLPQTSKASTAVTPSKQRANILQPKVITLAQHQPCLFQETSLLSTFPELQAEVPAASLVKTTAKEVSLPQPREHQGSSSKSVLRSKAVVSPIPVNVVTLPIPVVPPGSTPRVKTLSILQIVPPRTTNARAVPQPPSVSPHSTTRLTSPPVVQKMTVKRQILDMPQQIAYVTQQEVSHVVARDMTQQELTSAKPQEVSLTLKDMAQQDLQSTSQNVREPSPSNSQTLTEAGTRGMDRLIQATRNFDARQKEKHNITVQKQRIQAGNLQDTQLILQASLEMKCTLQEVGQGQPSSSTQAASLQKDIPIVSPMKTHQILTEIYPWTLEGSRLSTPSPEFAQLVQQITTEVHNPSTLQEDSPVQQIETSPPQLPLEDLMDQLSSLQETDPTSPDINPPRSLLEELFQIENLDHLVSHITQKTNSMPTTPPQESHKLPVEMNLRLQQEISPSPTLLGSSSLHAMEKDHLPPQPICHKFLVRKTVDPSSPLVATEVDWSLFVEPGCPPATSKDCEPLLLSVALTEQILGMVCSVCSLLASKDRFLLISDVSSWETRLGCPFVTMLPELMKMVDPGRLPVACTSFLARPVYNTSGSNKQHVTTKNTAKLDRETEELKHETIPLDVGKLIQQGRQAKGLRQKDLATKINEKPQVITDERIASKRVSVSRAPEGLHILSLIKIPYFQYVYIYRGSVNTVSRNLIVVLLSQPLPYP
ncbi:unnamed protein product [Acanthoscelides obtectus]|uniref:Multiprotein bridging factor 1 N-terminal domain-containing protein n=1 Tax=Acanthoscelides obtectus TaxID=200917 RepID=A0A9P0QA14_ACAOB|nr:unnamed protein product [Acanthoscelides obtectus]CAK1686270.1 Endothelial differentiation-related factor 1 homolog [Acanthoscelides obtectus]